MDDALHAATAAAFPGRAVESVGGTGPSWNQENRTVRVTFADEGSPSAAYLKVALDGDGSRIARERAALRHVRARERDPERADVPVPTVLTADPDATRPYLATEPVEGAPLLDRWSDADAEGRAALARALGRSLAALHAESFEVHGELAGCDEDGVLRVDEEPWPDLLLARIERLRETSPCDRFEDHFRRVAAAVDAARERLAGAPAALCHGDPAKPNAFLADGRVGLLDWERAHVGDPAREVYRAREQALVPLRGEAPELVGAFHGGYRARAGGLPAGYTEREPVYAAVRLLGVSGYFENYVEFREEGETAFATWLEAELDRRLARIERE